MPEAINTNPYAGIFKLPDSVMQDTSAPVLTPANAMSADSVTINGETKYSKKQLTIKQKIGVLIGFVAAGLGIFAALKKGKISSDASGYLFNNFDPSLIMKAKPTEAQLDAHVLNKIKNTALNLGFGENVTDEASISKFLEKYEAGSSWSRDAILDAIRGNKDKTQALRMLTGFKDENKLKLYDIRDIITNLPSNIDTDELDKLLKMYKASSSSYTSESFYLSNVINNALKDIKGTNRLIVFGDMFSGAINPRYDFEKFDIWEILNHSGLKKSSQEIIDFLSCLRKGTVGNSGYNLELIIKDSDVDLKIARKFLTSLNDNAQKVIDLNSLSSLMRADDINLKEVSKKLNSLPLDVLKKFDRADDVVTYLRFENFLGMTNINELNMAQKKELMNKLVKNNANSFSFGAYDICPLLPKNQQEYCSLLQKLSRSIGIDTKPLSAQDKKVFEQGLKNLVQDIKKIDLNNVTVSLKFSRDDFANEAVSIMSKLDETEARKVMDYFGFEIVNGKLKGYPINVNNGQKLSEIKSKATKKVVEKLRPVVSKFADNNDVVVSNGNKAVERELNEVLKGLPELRSIIGRAQHGTHIFTLDVHTLKVLQNVSKNPKFSQLSEQDQKLLSIASLLHDITKSEGVRDLVHPMESAFDAYYIIQKFDLPEDEQLKVYELIKSHNWLDRLNNPKNAADDIERIAQDIAFDSRNNNTFELAKILCEADLKSVKKDSSFFNNHKKTLEAMSQKVDGYIKRIHESQIVLPQTRIPEASQIANGVKKSKDGIENIVIHMNSASDDLSKYGFAPGTTKDNWQGLVHALDRQEQMSKFQTFSLIDTEALLSTSYMNPQSYRVFRKQGVILDVNPNDIHAGYYRDFGTGYSKDIELLKEDYLFKGKRKSTLTDNMWRSDRTEYRNYISDKIKQKLGIGNDEYIDLMDRIKSCKSITDIEAVDSNLAAKLKEVFDEMEAGKRRGGRAYNEMLVTRPKIQGVFSYDQPYEKIPAFLRKFAQDNDLPIIMFGKN